MYTKKRMGCLLTDPFSAGRWAGCPSIFSSACVDKWAALLYNIKD